MRTFYFRCWLILAAALPGALVSAPSYAQDAKYESDLTTWRTQHAADLQKPAGWLSLTGLDWLQEGDNSFGSAPDNKLRLAAGNPAHLGVLHLEKNSVQLLPPAGGDFPPELLDGGEGAK